MRTLVSVATLVVIWSLTGILGFYTWIWAWPISGALLTSLFVYYGIRIVPADPPHKAILLFRHRRQKIVLNEGWVWLPLSPVIFDAINIKVVKVNQDLPDQIVRTPDYAELAVSVSITWTPGRTTERATETEKAEAFLQFLNSGEEAGVKEIIEDVIRHRLRAWAFSEEEGPANWKEAIKSRDDTVAILLRAILGDEDLRRIHSDIPTTVLLKYFSIPRRQPLEFEAKKWGKNWKKLEKELSQLSPEEYNELKRQVEARRRIVQAASQGNGFFYKKALGITLNRFTINEIILRGKTAEAVDSRVQEEYEAEADEIEIQNVLKRAKELQDELGISPEQALEIVQTERKKVVKSIQEGKLNISPETRDMIERVLPQLFRR